MSSNSVVTDGGLHPATLSARVQLLLWQHRYYTVFFRYKEPTEIFNRSSGGKMNGGENHCQERAGAALSPRPLEGSQLPLSPFSTSQYAESLQTDCAHGPLWVRNWHLGLGLYLQLQSSTPHAPAESNFWGAFSRIPSFSRTEDQELRGKRSTFSRRRDHTFDNYPFEHCSFRTVYFYQAAGHISSF